VAAADAAAAAATSPWAGTLRACVGGWALTWHNGGFLKIGYPQIMGNLDHNPITTKTENWNSKPGVGFMTKTVYIHDLGCHYLKKNTTVK
jgi:hypothetical protein